MADTYFDDDEVSEYGEFLYSESKKLEGRSEIFHIAKLRELLRSALDVFQKERTAAAGTLDVVRKDATTATEETRDVLTRFYSFLGSLKKGSADVGSFFKGGKLGDLQRLKPADVQTKLETVMLGFETKDNQSFKDREDWKKELTTALSDLKLSLETKDSKRTDATRNTALKTAAYDYFLIIYNQVAKPAIAGILAELSRSDEYDLFFKDRQVKESSEDKKTQQEAAKKAVETKKNKKGDEVKA
jgi:hypothetical protein